MSLLLADVKRHYRLLQHKGYYSQLHAQNKQTNKLLSRQLVNGEQALINWVRSFNGKADLYIGRNPRTKTGKVACITNVCIDIDSVRPKDTAADYAQLQETIKAARWLCNHDKYTQGIIASSGNGVHIYWPLKKDWEVTQDQIKDFEENIRKLLKGKFNVQVDAIHDNPRLVKIIGTTATKGKFSLHRTSRFVSPICWTRLFDERVFKILQGDSKAQSVGHPTSVPKTEGINRSDLDYGLALRLKRDGAGPESIRAFLRKHGYRAPERPDDIERIIKKLYSPKTSVVREANEEGKHIEVYTPATHLSKYTRKFYGKEPIPETLPTGFPSFDRFTDGYTKGSLWVIGARPGVGKTSFCITTAHRLLETGKRVVFFTTETTWKSVFNRFVSVGTGIDFRKIKSGQLDSREQTIFEQYISKFQTYPLFIIDKAQPKSREVSQKISELRPDVFFFDHIHRIESRREQRRLDIGQFILELNNIARENNCPGIIGAQLNRAADYERPRLIHLKECGDLEEEAHIVVLISNITSDGSLKRVDFAKHREGELKTLEMAFEGKTTQFKEIE